MKPTSGDVTGPEQTRTHGELLLDACPALVDFYSRGRGADSSSAKA
ncbi:MAG: hypothetical protein Q4C87_09390 [Actinomycetaceae bacterium]|nr:hypothetical protein [Actinomycetaceae bacterium]